MQSYTTTVRVIYGDTDNMGIAYHAKAVVKENAEKSISSVGLDGLLYLMGISEREIQQKWLILVFSDFPRSIPAKTKRQDHERPCLFVYLALFDAVFFLLGYLHTIWKPGRKDARTSEKLNNCILVYSKMMPTCKNFFINNFIWIYTLKSFFRKCIFFMQPSWGIILYKWLSMYTGIFYRAKTGTLSTSLMTHPSATYPQPISILFQGHPYHQNMGWVV